MQVQDNPAGIAGNRLLDPGPEAGRIILPIPALNILLGTSVGFPQIAYAGLTPEPSYCTDSCHTLKMRLVRCTVKSLGVE